MFKIMSVLLLLSSASSAFAGGANTYTCENQIADLKIQDHSVIGGELTISMWASLNLTVSTPELKDPTATAKAVCYDAFKNNNWNRFICIVERKAVLVAIDKNDKCTISSVAQ